METINGISAPHDLPIAIRHFDEIGDDMKTLLALVAAAVLLAQPATAQIGQRNAPDFRSSFDSPQIYSPQGDYLGNLNGNQFDPNSVANPFGAGNPFRGDGVNNPFSPNYVPGLTRRCSHYGC